MGKSYTFYSSCYFRFWQYQKSLLTFFFRLSNKLIIRYWTITFLYSLWSWSLVSAPIHTWLTCFISKYHWIQKSDFSLVLSIRNFLYYVTFRNLSLLKPFVSRLPKIYLLAYFLNKTSNFIFKPKIKKKKLWKNRLLSIYSYKA